MTVVETVRLNWLFIRNFVVFTGAESTFSEPEMQHLSVTATTRNWLVSGAIWRSDPLITIDSENQRRPKLAFIPPNVGGGAGARCTREDGNCLARV